MCVGLYLYAMLPDQTPTPTRFLQNCEEVGLFKEIEEEFLQAQEEEKSKQVHFIEKCKPQLSRVSRLLAEVILKRIKSKSEDTMLTCAVLMIGVCLLVSVRLAFRVTPVREGDKSRRLQIFDLLQGKTHQAIAFFPVN